MRARVRRAHISSQQWPRAPCCWRWRASLLPLVAYGHPHCPAPRDFSAPPWQQPTRCRFSAPRATSAQRSQRRPCPALRPRALRALRGLGATFPAALAAFAQAGRPPPPHPVRPTLPAVRLAHPPLPRACPAARAPLQQQAQAPAARGVKSPHSRNSVLPIALSPCWAPATPLSRRVWRAMASARTAKHWEWVQQLLLWAPHPESFRAWPQHGAPLPPPPLLWLHLALFWT